MMRWDWPLSPQQLAHLRWAFRREPCCTLDFGGTHYHCHYCDEVCGLHGHPKCVEDAERLHVERSQP